MNNRPTPETDAAIYPMNQVDIVWPDFARKLERERDGAREKAERYRIEANAMMMQRDEARDILRKLLEIIPEPECQDFEHTKEDRHTSFENCPVMARYDALIAQAEEAAK